MYETAVDGKSDSQVQNIRNTTDSIAYVRQHGLLLINDHDSIYKVRGDGSVKTLLTNSGGAPSWTPDGKIIFTSSRSGSAQIWIMDENGNNAHQIGQLDSSTGAPVMAQQARNGLIVFQTISASATPGTQEGNIIWSMQSDGSQLKQLVGSTMRPAVPSLAQSGRWISFTSETVNPYHREIWRINTDGSGLTQLTFSSDPDYPDANASSISPDETTIAMFSGQEADYGAAGITQSPLTWGHRNIAVIPVAGGARRTVTSCNPVTTQTQFDALGPTDCIAADNPVWAPDGAWILYDIGIPKLQNPGTWIIDSTGQNSQQFYPMSKGVERVPMKFSN